MTPRVEAGVVHFAPGEGLMGLALATRQPVISPDVLHDPRFREHERARANDIASSVMLPLLARERVCGILAIFTKTPHDFSGAELDLLSSLAAHAAVALENARLYAELKRAYEELRRAQEGLVRSEKLRAVGQLGAGMAHDLNNVLAVILGQVELLKLRAGSAETLEGLRTLETAAADGAEVVRRLQDFARLRGGSPLVPVELRKAVREALEIARPRWKDEPERRGVRIEVREMLPPLPPVLGHAPEIREALLNLIFNAVDAMPQGGRLTLDARLVPRAEGQGTGDGGGRDSPPPIPDLGFVELTVADTGVGMAPAVRERALEPFFTTKGPQGTGLGLSVVYGIMERHGGRIDVESAPGCGTAIRLTFRAAPPAPGPPPPCRRAVAPRRLLLIDDDPTVRRTLASLLRAAGHRVAEAAAGPEGLARLREEAPDAVLTDLGMPEMTGWEVARAVKAEAPALPVLLLTGWGDQAAVEAEGEACVDRVLGKPVRLEDLLAAIAELTGPPAR